MSHVLDLLGTLAWPDLQAADRAEFQLARASRWLAARLVREGVFLRFRGQGVAGGATRDGLIDLLHRQAGEAVGGAVQVRWGPAAVEWVAARADHPLLADLPPPVRRWVRPAVGLVPDVESPLDRRFLPFLVAAYERLRDPRQRAALVVQAARLEAPELARLLRMGAHRRGEDPLVRQARLVARAALARQGLRG